MARNNRSQQPQRQGRQTRQMAREMEEAFALPSEDVGFVQIPKNDEGSKNKIVMTVDDNLEEDNQANEPINSRQRARKNKKRASKYAGGSRPVAKDRENANRKRIAENYKFAISGSIIQSSIGDEPYPNFVALIPCRKTFFVNLTVPWSCLLPIIQNISNSATRKYMQANGQTIDHCSQHPDSAFNRTREITELQNDIDIIVLLIKRDEALANKDPTRQRHAGFFQFHQPLCDSMEDVVNKKLTRRQLDRELITRRQRLHRLQNTSPGIEFWLYWKSRSHDYAKAGDDLQQEANPSLSYVRTQRAVTDARNGFRYQDFTMFGQDGIEALGELEHRITAHLLEHFRSMKDVDLDFEFFYTETGSTYTHGPTFVIDQACVDIKNDLIDKSTVPSKNMRHDGWKCGFVLMVPLCDEGMALRFHLPNDAVKDTFYPAETLYIPFGSAVLMRADTPYSDMYGSRGNMRLNAFIFPTDSDVPFTGSTRTVWRPTEHVDLKGDARPQMMLVNANRFPQFGGRSMFYPYLSGDRYRHDVFREHYLSMCPAIIKRLEDNCALNVDITYGITHKIVDKFIKNANKGFDVTRGAISSTNRKNLYSDGAPPAVYPNDIFNNVDKERAAEYRTIEARWNDTLYPPKQQKKEDGENDIDEEEEVATDDDEDDVIEQEEEAPTGKKKKSRRTAADICNTTKFPTEPLIDENRRYHDHSIRFPKHDVTEEFAQDEDSDDSWEDGDKMFDFHRIVDHRHVPKSYKGSKYTFLVELQEGDKKLVPLSSKLLAKYAYKACRAYLESKNVDESDCVEILGSDKSPKEFVEQHREKERARNKKRKTPPSSGDDNVVGNNHQDGTDNVPATMANGAVHAPPDVDTGAVESVAPPTNRD